MLILGHAGITLGAATFVAGAANYNQPKASWFATLSRYLDIRFLLVGSLLPDIIDKPVGQYFFRETFNNGRIFSHTLLFLVVIAAAGFYLLKRHRQVWMLSLAAGTMMHLVLDQIWNAPATLFWPFMGFTFAKIELTGYVSNIFRALLSDPSVYIPEAVGLVILVWFAVLLVRRRDIGDFIRYGKVS
jgi:inner membrane protein